MQAKGIKGGVSQSREMASDAGMWSRSQRRAAEAGGWRVLATSRWVALRARKRSLVAGANRDRDMKMDG